MRWLRTGLYFFAGLVAILLVLGVVLFSLDFGRFKGQAESLVTELLGRDLRIEGGLHAFIGENIELYGEDVFLANPQWADNESFVSASKIHIIVDTRSLFTRPINITLLEVDGLRVNIERNANGDASWIFPALKKNPDSETGKKTQLKTSLPIVVGSVSVRDSIVSYHSPDQEQALILTTETLLSSLDTQFLSLEHHGAFNDTELYFKQTIGPVENLLSMQNLDLTFNGNIGEITLKGTSWIDDLMAIKKPHLNIDIEGPNVTYLTELFSLQTVTTGPLNLKASIIEDDEKMLSSLQGVFGEFKINLEGGFQSLQNFDGFELKLTAAGPNIASVAALAGLNGLPAQEFEVSTSIKEELAGYRVQNFRLLVDDEVLNINGFIGGGLRAVGFLAGASEVEFDIQGSDIGASVILLGNSIEQLPQGAFNFSGKVEKEDDKIILSEIEAALGDNNEYQLQTSGFLTIGQEFVGSEIKLSGQGTSLAALAKLAGQEGIPDFPFDISADLRRGDSRTYFEGGNLKYGILTLEFSGELGDKPLEDDLLVNFNTSIPNIKNFLDDFGIASDKVPDSELKASGSIQQSAGLISVEQFELDISDANLKINGDIGIPPSLAGTLLQLELEGADLSKLLPDNIDGESLGHAFAASTTLFLGEEALRLEQLEANIAHTTLSGDISLQRSPFLNSGDFDLIADSPNILHLVSTIEGLEAFSEESLKFKGSGHWEENFWSFEDTRLDMDEGYLEINGSLDGFPTFDRTNLDVEWVTPNVAKLSAIVGRKLPELPLRLNAHLDGTREVMSMNDFELSLGSSDLKGDITLSSGDVPALELTLHSTLIELTELLPENPEVILDEAGVGIEVETESDNGRIIPEVEFDKPLEVLKAFNAEIDFGIDEIRGSNLDFFNVMLKANIIEGELSIQNFSLADKSDGRYSVSGELIPFGVDGIDYKLQAEGNQISMVFRAENEEDLDTLPQFELQADLRGRGDNLHELAGSTDGYVRAISGPGLLPSGNLAMFSNDLLTELISTLNPFTKDDGFSKVSCSTIVLNFEDGIVRGAPSIVHQTDKLLILANSSIDLNTEALNADFKVVPQKGLGLSFSSLLNPYVKLIGTLGSPSIVINPEGVLIQGGVAVATGGISILAMSFKDRFLSAPDPCGSAHQNSLEEQQQNSN